MAMNAREVLQLIITGDGKSAIAEMERVGAASKRNLGETERSLSQVGSRLTSIGLVTTAAGIAAGTGLFQVSKGAAQLDTDIRRIEGNLGSAAGAAIEFARNSNEIGLSDQQATSYVASIGELAVGLGLAREQAAGLTTETVSLISQLSTLKGQTPAEGLDAIKSALIGEYDPLQRLIPSISAAAIEHRALADSGKASAKELTMAEKAAATFAIVLDDARGTLERAGDANESMAMRTARLAAAWGDMKTDIGEGALPVMERLISVAGAGIGVFEQVDDATAGWASRLVTVATVGAVAGGGLAIVVGQGLRAVDTIRDLNTRLHDADGTLTRGGRAARTFGIALGSVAAAAALMEGINWATGVDRDIEDALNDTIAAGDDADVALARFVDSVDANMRKFRLMDGPKWLASELGILGQSMLELPGSEFSRIMRSDVQGAFDDLRARAPETAGVVLDALEQQASGLDRNSEAYRNLRGFIDDNRDSLSSAAAANQQLASEQDRVGASAADTAWTLDKLAYSYGRADVASKDAAAGARDYADALQAGFSPLLGLADANTRLSEAQKRLAEVESMSGRDIADANRGVEDARRRVNDATRNLADAQQRLNEVLADDPMFGLRSVSPEQELADARNRLAEANRRLALDPGDAMALTMRDLAIADLEDASRRVQQAKRDAEQRADQIEGAQRAVESAQRGLDDANRGVADAQARLAEILSQHGPNSDEYAAAARDVVQANLDVQTATADLVEFIEENGIGALGQVNDELDDWIAKGGPLADAARNMKEQIEPLVDQALRLAGALRQVADAPSSWEGSFVGQVFDLFGAASPEEVAASGGRVSPTPGRRTGRGGGAGGGGGGGGSWGDDSALIVIDADDRPARRKANRLHDDIEDLNPNVPLDAETRAAAETYLGFARDLERTTIELPVDLDWESLNQANDQLRKIVSGGGFGTPYRPDILELGYGQDFNRNGVIGRQLGGPVDPGLPYDLAENQAEAVVFSRPGHVIPDLRRFAEGAAAAGGSSGPVLDMGGVTIQVVAKDDESAGAAVVQTLRTVARRAGRGLRVADMGKALR